VIAASPLGKLKMVTQVVAVLLLLLGWERFPLLLGLGKLALWAVLATAIGSAADYFWRFSRAVQQVATPISDFAAAQARRDRAASDRSSGAA
jgi:phosphatidylglycerophosphate synthase